MADKTALQGAVAETAGPSLRTLVDRLHPAVLDVAAAPRGLDVEVGDPVILDPSETVTVPEHSVVLAVGIDSDEGWAGLLHELGGASATAAVLKHAGTPSPAVLHAAAAAGVAVLLAPPALSWGQLYALLRTAGSSGGSAAGAQLPEAPLGDLFALANAVAALVGGATTIEDPNNRVLAYSNLDHPIDPARQATILGRQVPSGWIQRLQDAGVFRRLWQTDEVIRITEFVAGDDEYLPRLAVAVRAGGELLGSLWVIEAEQPLDTTAEAALRDAARLAALHLLRHRAAADGDRQRRADALLALLEGRSRGELTRDALGIDADRRTVVVALQVLSEDGPSGVVAAQRVADLVTVYCESYRRQATCAATGSAVYALIALDDNDITSVVTLATEIVDRAAGALRVRIVAGVGSPASSLDAVSRSRREADEVVNILARGTEESVAAIDSVRPQVILDRLRGLADQDPDLVAGKIATLVTTDIEKGTSWARTLRAHFDAFGDMATAAAAVHVHPNTFRYRLRRITDVFGLDLSDPDERLVAELQLRFLDLPD